MAIATKITEAALERLNDAHQAYLRADGAVFATPNFSTIQAQIRASNVLLDACIGAGMSHDEPDHCAWAAERVTRWLIQA